jgi:hypothetical protein
MGKGGTPQTHPHRRDHQHHDTPDTGREHASHPDRRWPHDWNSDGREPGANWPHTRIFSWPLAILGDSFDTRTREAWALAYNLVAETMLEGAAAARPISS